MNVRSCAASYYKPPASRFGVCVQNIHTVEENSRGCIETIVSRTFLISAALHTIVSTEIYIVLLRMTWHTPLYYTAWSRLVTPDIIFFFRTQKFTKNVLNKSTCIIQNLNLKLLFFPPKNLSVKFKIQKCEFEILMKLKFEFTARRFWRETLRDLKFFFNEQMILLLVK